MCVYAGFFCLLNNSQVIQVREVAAPRVFQLELLVHYFLHINVVYCCIIIGIQYVV